MNFIRDNWHGNFSLFWSFWVNLVLVRVLILYLEQFTHPPYTEQTTSAVIQTTVFFVVFHLIVYAWQARGVIKTCDRLMAERNPYITVLMVQLGLVVSLFITIFFVLGAFQALFEDPSALQKNKVQRSAPLLKTYTLTVTPNDKWIDMKGDFRIGVTKSLEALLQQNPQVEGVVFSSNGGRITESRGVARLILENNLNTYVFDVCKSACATAFIAGRIRTLGADAKLGFHQFSMKSRLKTPYIDPVAEQEIDLAFYASQNIKASFLEKAFGASQSSIWYPSFEELLQAGIVHKIIPNRYLQTYE
ncbi:hypothetical protein A9Q83_05850 [Alphaproteobacteria bacterium 46_93_T64]|nr:hypothetical protein A9Q83_05850 [Alphaproteobacteria bacterium 46_93_T64]